MNPPASPAAKLWDLIVKAAPEMPDPTAKPPHSEIEEPAHISKGLPHPEIDDAVRALLVITGVTIKFVGNYWMLMKGGLRGGVAIGASFEEWRTELNALMDKAGNKTGRPTFG
jgi:hypothetical protein